MLKARKENNKNDIRFKKEFFLLMNWIEFFLLLSRRKVIGPFN
jgi:hypothetical protein